MSFYLFVALTHSTTTHTHTHMCTLLNHLLIPLSCKCIHIISMFSEILESRVPNCLYEHSSKSNTAAALSDVCLYTYTCAHVCINTLHLVVCITHSQSIVRPKFTIIILFFFILFFKEKSHASHAARNLWAEDFPIHLNEVIIKSILFIGILTLMTSGNLYGKCLQLDNFFRHLSVCINIIWFTKIWSMFCLVTIVPYS